MILAGLQQTKSTKTDGEVFLLSDLPLVGHFFEPNSKKVERTELIIFIRPTMVKSEAYASLLAKNKIGSEETSKEVARYFETGKFHDAKNETMDAGNRKFSSFEKTVLPKSITSDTNAEEKTEAAANRKQSPKQNKNARRKNRAGRYDEENRVNGTRRQRPRSPHSRRGETAPQKRAEAVEKLLAKNPFGSKSAAAQAGARAATARTQNAPRSNCGQSTALTASGKFDLFDTAAKTSYTVGLRQELSEKVPYTVDFYDDETNSVSVSSNLESLTLTLKTPDAPTGPAPQPANLTAATAAPANKNGAANAQKMSVFGARKTTEQAR